MVATATGERNSRGTGLMDGRMDGLKTLPARLKSFYGDVRTEMKKVTYPSSKEVWATTWVVLVTVAIFGLFFFGVDAIFTRVMDALFHFLGAL
jgi:preprotein translocase subunit SecE